ncbi:type II toxin-antitoxin system RelE family toxin [Corynebacterium sp. 20_84]
MAPQYEILYERAVLKALKKIDKSIARRIVTAIEELSHEPRPVGSIKLSGGDGERRIRVGDYRIIYRVHDDRLVVVVLRAAHRREVYR